MEAAFEYGGSCVHGDLLAATKGRPWTGADQRVREPWNVHVWTGSGAVVIEYRDEASAKAALNGAQPGDRVELPVFYQSPKGSTVVFLRGRKVGGDA